MSEIFLGSFREMIERGNYDDLHGFAKSPDDILGQAPRLVDGTVKLACPFKELNTEQVYFGYGDKMADLSDLLDYGVRNPDMQFSFPIAIIWKTDTGWLLALLSGEGIKRVLSIRRTLRTSPWSSGCRFLIKQ